MNTFSQEQSASREKTLLVALLLSMWGPLATGIAVIMSASTTQLADFIRRSAELVALFVSWWVFRHLARNKELAPARKVRMEKISYLFVSAALGISAIVMLALALSRIGTFEPGGNVYPGLVIAVLGLFTNTWFWRRYARLNAEQYSSIIDASKQLYRAKTFVDLCVIVALASVAIIPAHPATRYIDLLGSVILAAYLLWSSAKTARQARQPAAVSSSKLAKRSVN